MLSYTLEKHKVKTFRNLVQSFDNIYLVRTLKIWQWLLFNTALHLHLYYQTSAIH